MRSTEKAKGGDPSPNSFVISRDLAADPPPNGFTISLAPSPATSALFTTPRTSQRSRSGAHPSISLTPSPMTRADYSSRGPDRSSSTMRHRYRTSNTSFKKNVDMQHSRTTKSRLMDVVSPPSPYPSQDEISMSGKFKLGILKAGMLKSGLLGTEEDNDDDPLFDEDIPDRFNKEHLGTSTILEWVSLITILIFFICSILIPYSQRKEVLSLNLWKWVVLVLVLICGRLMVAQAKQRPRINVCLTSPRSYYVSWGRATGHQGQCAMRL